jgi:hypothetical protein
MSLSTLKAKWDSFMTNRFPNMVIRQNTYFTNHGRYFQGLYTNAVPVDPNELVPDLTVHPTDQIESWADANFTFPATMPARVWIDVYKGPQGYGWTLNAQVIVGTNTFIICVQGAGNETDRVYDWRIDNTITPLVH